ncbi:chitin synthase-domain-containing protein [Lipomyces japonicus]|uniref:chitin synthase-domain-containing protein n=1 Tax=Lipomyces japonicus TaxID=56871 RepID=UPI0034CF2387
MDPPLSSTLVQPSPAAVLSALKRAYEAREAINITSTTLAIFDRFSTNNESAFGSHNGNDSEGNDYFDSAFMTAIWEHGRRRAEDQTVLISPARQSTTQPLSNLKRLISTFPNIPDPIISFLNALTPFFSIGRQNISIFVELSLNLSGQVLASRVKLSDDHIEPSAIKSVLAESPVFKYLIASSSIKEMEVLSIHNDPLYYALLNNGNNVDSQQTIREAEAWREALSECGLSESSAIQNIFAILSGILLFANENPDDVLEGATLLGLDPNKLDSSDAFNSLNTRWSIISSAYASILSNVVGILNKYLTTFDASVDVAESEEVCSVVNIVDAPSASKVLALKSVFSTDSALGTIATEMANDGLSLPTTPLWINQTLQQQEPKGSSPLISGLSPEIIDISSLVEDTSILARSPSSTRLHFEDVIRSSRVWHVLVLSAYVPNSDDSWSNTVVTSQIKSWFLPNWLQKYRAVDFTADFDVDEFVDRYAALLQASGVNVQYPYAIDSWAQSERGWGADGFFHGHNRIWLREDVWRTLEGELDGIHLIQQQERRTPDYLQMPMQSAFDRSGVNTPASRENLIQSRPSYHPDDLADEDLTMYGSKYAANDPEAQGRHVVVEPTSTVRKIWVTVVWAFTFWIPSFMLRYVGRMKRPDVRMAWREKITICFFICIMNAIIIFYMIWLGKILCPDFDKVWNVDEVSQHIASNNFYVTIHGKVYDISKFWKLQHSDNGIDTTQATMDVFAGQDLSNYFPPPLSQACPGLVTSDEVWLTDNTTVEYSTALHTCGSYKQASNTTKLHEITWYNDVFLPRISEYYKGELVVTKSTVYNYGQDGFNNWAIIDGKIYDLTNYFYTIDLYPSSESTYYEAYDFLDSTVKSLFKNNPGEDITEQFYGSTAMSSATRQNNLNCLKNAFYAGQVDFRKSARCQVSNYILLVIAILLASVILVKFLASLQFGSKRNPDLQDKFVICQIPAYTEGEDQLRKGIDSLTALKYDNKRKLLFIICDGVVVGGGNEKPTPNIVLEILGSDPRLDPPALAFKSVGEGSQQLNYGKVYSGLYEFDGSIVPYVVVVKVGKPSEISKPGNRGKRDSQCLLLDFLNKVHFKAPMSPLQLEIFHQLNNVIGVDPELYEYLLMVDADTSVSEDALNRLVACCARDSRIAGIAGQTSLQNEDKSWWTMIQVYEYYISHHLSKAFESLFGSVTCLPGCFSMYRLRTADKGRPLIISNKIVEEYSDGNVNTLHKKNLLSLGEDRYLTTLMTKYFPRMRYTFTPDANAQTAVPETWSVLISQRRRWINSTIHNLGELAFLPDLCGFCIFSMRFVVIIDLVGTLMLPSVVVYIGYLLYVIITHSGPFPMISVIMLAAIYGLQALVFILHKQWQHIGWMIIYLLAYPVYSFVLPVYSFWNQDNFSWGSTRVVVGERGDKQIVAINDEGFDERSIPLQTWDAYAVENNLPGRYRPNVRGSNEKGAASVMYNDLLEESYEMDDMRSVYSAHPPAPMSTYNNRFSSYGAPPPRPATVMSNYSHAPSAYPYAQYSPANRPASMMTFQQQPQQYQQQFPPVSNNGRYSTLSHY